MVWRLGYEVVIKTVDKWEISGVLLAEVAVEGCIFFMREIWVKMCWI